MPWDAMPIGSMYGTGIFPYIELMFMIHYIPYQGHLSPPQVHIWRSRQGALEVQGTFLNLWANDKFIMAFTRSSLRTPDHQKCTLACWPKSWCPSKNNCRSWSTDWRHPPLMQLAPRSTMSGLKTQALSSERDNSFNTETNMVPARSWWRTTLLWVDISR